MPTAIGVDTLTSVTRQHIEPTITDNVYASNVLFYRWNKANKRIVQGGRHIEVPLLYKEITTGGAYSGFEVLDTSTSDTVKNAAFGWKQHYTSIAIDGLTLIQNDSPLAIASIVGMQSQQAVMQLAENLADGLFQDASADDPKDLDGLGGAVGNASVGDATYGEITRSANTWWNSQIDSSTATLTISALQSTFGSATKGGQHPTIILSRQEQYNRYLALNQSSTFTQPTNRSPTGQDEVLAQAGFTNALFNNVPWVVDSHVDDGPNASNSKIYLLNENVFNLVVSPKADFIVEDWRQPVNQDGYVQFIFWAGNVVCQNAALQGALTALTA
jgi:hypothetical protein